MCEFAFVCYAGSPSLTSVENVSESQWKHAHHKRLVNGRRHRSVPSKALSLYIYTSYISFESGVAKLLAWVKCGNVPGVCGGRSPQLNWLRNKDYTLDQDAITNFCINSL